MADNPDKRVEREEDKSYTELVPKGDRHRQAEAAVRLRLAAASWSEIAEVLDYASPTLARQAVERHLADTVSDDDREMARWTEGQRLLRVMRSLYPGATSPTVEVEIEGKKREIPNPDHLGYAKVYLSYVDRRIKLYGLDAPTELNVAYSPRQEELNRAVQETLEQIRGQFPEEADILDAEIMEEEEA